MANGKKYSLRGLITALLWVATAGPAFAIDRVVGANATLDIEPGARSAALGSATMAVDGDYLGLLSNPYQLADVGYAWGSFSHTEYYEDTKYDFASAALPLGKGLGLGVAFARFGADDIPYIKEGEPLPEGANYNTLSIADYVFSVSVGKRLTDRLSLGVSFHGLYREIDQTGFGFRGDAGLRYRVLDDLYVSGLLKGWTSSAASWESGEFEYSSPEFYLAANYGLDIPYLYGRLNFYWQGAGLFHQESRELDFDEDNDGGGRIWEDPLDWLSGGRGGVEFAFDFGLSLRAGLSSFTTFQSVTAGAGLTIAKFLKIDYAFESHPVLSPVHRVSVSVSPYLFAKKPREGTPEAWVRPKPVQTEPSEDELEEPVVGSELVETDAADVVSTEEGPREKDVLSTPAATEKNESVNRTAVEGTPVPAPEPSANPVFMETDDEILE